jgi:Response regulator containing a CheY-like receiver domain and a GGDEF domain
MIMPGQSFESAMAAVDKALYDAKNSGRNNVILGMVLEENESSVLN